MVVLAELAGKDVLTTATVIPTVSPNRNHMLFSRGDLLVHLSNTGAKTDAHLNISAAVEASTTTEKTAKAEATRTNPPHTSSSCVKLSSLDARWQHICTNVRAGELAPCANVTQPELLPQLGRELEVSENANCWCRAAKGTMEACFGSGTGGEPVVYALGQRAP